MTDARLTQAPALVLAEASPAARCTQVAALVLANRQAEAGRLTQAPALVLSSSDIEARVTQAAALVLADAVPCLTRWAQCWKITVADGGVFAFTSHDREITFCGVTYSPCDGLAASAVELAAAIGSVGNQELVGIVSDDAISEADLFSGRFDGALVEVWMVPWMNGGGEIPWRMAAGVTGKLSQGDRGFTMEVLTPGARLQQQPLLQTYTPSCRFELGDERCAFDLESLRVTGTVTSVAPLLAPNAASRRIFADSSRSEPEGWFNLGLLTWTGGANAGARSEVKAFDAASGQFVLWAPMLHRIEVGDTYSVVPGCDKTPDSCKTKFDNFINYGGFPDVPGRDSITESPDSK